MYNTTRTRLHYRRASSAEVAPLHAIVAECGLHMRDTLGLSHWVPPWPLWRMERDAQERQVWAVLDDSGSPVGTFTIGETAIADYPPDSFSDPTAAALYLNRLAIRPALQHPGLGRACMQEVAALASRAHCRFIRCDAVTAHLALCQFYRKLGYVDRGRFANLGIDVTCFEITLTAP